MIPFASPYPAHAWRRSGLSVPFLVASVFVLALATAPPAGAAVTGKVQGRILATDTGEAIGYADVLLIPADTTMRKVGGLTNADGTYLLEAPPGRYTIQIRALSYAVKRVEGIVVTAGQVLPFDTALESEAIQQQEIVVEARARQNTENSMLAVRKKAATVGDAVSAEQVRKSPDRNTAEVLRRVTGLTMTDGKYVFVRGLGERYSSTEIDGVRIASPEQNKRVVPLDLVPASLLDNVVVQKTYTADRAGEFGGGDVQVHTKDFPGSRTWSISLLQGYGEGVTFQDRTTYTGGAGDLWGFGAGARSLPQPVVDATQDHPLVAGQPPYGYPRSQLAGLARSFANVWTPNSKLAIPNGNFALTYGDEYHLLGHEVGLIASASMSRTFTHRTESQRFFASPPDTFFDYAVDRSNAVVQLGAITGLSYRLSPSHSYHLRGFFTNSADDEVRVYQGSDHNRVESLTGQWIQHRDTRLMYLQRDVLSGTFEGRDEFPHVMNVAFDWKFTRSSARAQQPDRREVTYDEGYYVGPRGGLVSYWGLGSPGVREFGDLHDDGWGTTLTGAVPYRLGGLGQGKVMVGYDRQTKDRHNFYRRFNLYTSSSTDPTAPPESLFSQNAFTGTAGTGYMDEATLDQDNYHANSKIQAGFVSADVPFGHRLRSTLGVRVERGTQDVRSYNLFRPDIITAEGAFDNTDWLPSANLTWSVTDAINVRLGASRTLSRPDMNELSPSPTLEYVGGYRQAGNPNLHRAVIENYDARFEVFPTASEVFAVGYFYKSLHEPIEQQIQGAVPPLIGPVNSDHGRDAGVELEARSGLGRYWGRLRGLSVNANASFISSHVVLKTPLTQLSSLEHPLQGQADYVANAGLFYESGRQRAQASVLFGVVGRRLRTLGYLLPDIYDQPTTSLDATLGWAPGRGWHVQASARNLLDPNVQQLQGGKEVSAYRSGRSYSLALSFGS
ncbi:MAG: TonB-dependent receptor domain-containing protein [Candidatus Eisenbacteria bacterium]